MIVPKHELESLMEFLYHSFGIEIKKGRKNGKFVCDQSNEYFRFMLGGSFFIVRELPGALPDSFLVEVHSSDTEMLQTVSKMWAATMDELEKQLGFTQEELDDAEETLKPKEDD